MTDKATRRQPSLVKLSPPAEGPAIPAQKTISGAALGELWRSRTILDELSQTHQHVPSEPTGPRSADHTAAYPEQLDSSDGLPRKRTWYNHRDMLDETPLFHAVSILEWAIVIKDAPTSAGTLVKKRHIMNRLDKRLLGSDTDYQYTNLGPQLFRSMRYLVFFQDSHQAYHPYVDLVLECASSTGMAELARDFQPNHRIKLNPMVQDPTREDNDKRINTQSNGITESRGQPLIRQFGHCVEAFTDLIRDKLNNSSFATRIRDRQRLFAARESGALKWLDSIFRANEHVKVEHLELAFELENDRQMAYEFTRSVWTGFWNNLRHQDVGKRLIGRQWTLHWIKGRGLVYRCLLIFDTTAQPADIETFKVCWIQRFPGVTRVAESNPDDSFRSMVSICGNLPSQRERLERAVRLQCWYGWLLEIKGTKPSQTYGRSECLRQTGSKRIAQLSTAQALHAYMEMVAMRLCE